MRLVPIVRVLASASIALLGSAMMPTTSHAATFVPCGNTAALVSAINSANMAGSGSIFLSPGCTYTLTAPAATTINGPDGLPPITGDLSISGSNATISRSAMATQFRIFEVDPGGSLTLNAVGVRGGDTASSGGGVLNAGTLELNGARVRNNTATSAGGGVANQGGSMEANDSTITANTSGNNGGGIVNFLAGSSIELNSGSVTDNNSAFGGGISNFADARLAGSTITNNTAQITGGGIANLSTVVNQGSTITNNQPDNCAFNPVPGCVG